MPNEKAPRELDESIMDLAKIVGSHAIGSIYPILVVADELRKLREAIERKTS